MLSDSRAALFAKVLANRTRHISFVLDGVHGVHNLAAIARSCDAWGVQDLHVIAQPDEYIPKGHGNGDSEFEGRGKSMLQRIRTESSAKNVSKNCHKWLTIREHDSPAPCLEQLRRSGYKILVSSLSPDAESLHDIDLSDKCAFVFGNEKHGVTKEMNTQADGFFTVPMMGFVESMNVSVAVGTTACLAVTKCRDFIPEAQFFLSAAERKELARVWLKERFRSSQGPRVLHTKRDLTKLGYKTERIIASFGMFASVDDDNMMPSEQFWKLAMRLNGEGGRRLACDFIRRKVGVLSTNGFRKRCIAINMFIGGSHALTCEAALAQYESLKVSRRKLQNHFEMVCETVSREYEPHFDQFGVPNVPPHCEEFHHIFDELAVGASRKIANVCIEAANDIFGVGADEVAAIITQANLRDITACIADTVRCGKDRRLELQAVLENTEKNISDLRRVLAERYLLDISIQNLTRHGHAAGGTGESLPQIHRGVLQVLLRLSNAAILCSEIHQAFWDRYIHNKHVIRVHQSSFGLLEMLLSDSYSEILLLGGSHSNALFWGIGLWERALANLRTQFGIEL